MQDCFHCGEPVPPGLSLSVLIQGRPEAMCCAGCQAVAQTIIDYGLENFYRYRTGPSRKPETIVPEALLKFDIYDDRQFQSTFTESAAENQRVVHLLLEDIECPACTWLIESRLARLPGIAEIKVNYASRRAEVRWVEDRLTLGRILNTIHTLGYRAYPYDPARGRYALEQERKLQLRRLGLAGILGMQVMMFSIAIYAGDWSGMEVEYKSFFNWICLLLTTPVMIYSARPFFVRAWRDLMTLHTGMDVPVALGLGIAFASSIWSTISGAGQVYYDSVVMFVFLLLTARYLEFTAQIRAMQHYDEASRIIPAVATRLEEQSGVYRQQPVAVAKLQPGDRLLVRPGEIISADGLIVAGVTAVDESIITGESMPVKKSAGDRVIGGSTNIDSPIQMDIEKIGTETVLANILKLVDAGRQDKPAIVRLTNRIASWFVLAVLVLAVAVAIYWWQVDRTMWIPVTISVLVITCPCALSLATPSAMTAAVAGLMSRGMIVINNSALETLNRVSDFVFDKTGTITEGRLGVHDVSLTAGTSREACLAIAAGLERDSEHPIARAILDCSVDVAPWPAEQVQNFPGQGITGVIHGRHYYLGTGEFIHAHTGLGGGGEPADQTGAMAAVILADQEEILCTFNLTDNIRQGAAGLIAALQQRGREVHLLSGDAWYSVSHVAENLGIKNYQGRMTPTDKLSRMAELICNGGIVAAAGDGINDAPVLARAHVSIAMGAGVDVARLNADMILMNNNLDILHAAIKFSGKTMRTIRQNYCWAIGYNLLAIPAAMTGLVAPWLAAIGMSLSSLVVVGNSVRLNRN